MDEQTTDAQTYAGKRNTLLTQCLRLTEDIYSGIGGDAEILPELLDRRMDILEAIRKLDEDAGAARESVPAEALAQSDAVLRLIQNLDEKIKDTMRDARDKMLDAMHANAMERKFTGYTAAAEPEKGKHLNEKK
jgi:hypothetical protein